MAIQNLQNYAGATWTIYLSCHDSNGDALDLTGVEEITYRIGPVGGTTLEATKSAGNITVTDAAAGECTITITKAMQDAAGLAPGLYNHQCRVKFSDTDQHDQIAGTFRILPSLI